MLYLLINLRFKLICENSKLIIQIGQLVFKSLRNNETDKVAPISLIDYRIVLLIKERKKKKICLKTETKFYLERQV